MSKRLISIGIALLMIIYAGMLLYPFKWQPPHLKPNGAQLHTTGVLEFPTPGVAYTDRPPGWIGHAADLNELAVVLTISSLVDRQYGPARILTISADPHLANLTVGQRGVDLVIRLRTPDSDLNGDPPFVVRDVFKVEAWQTIAISIRAEKLTVTINHKLALNEPLPNSALKTWDRNFLLALGNEPTGSRPWLGAITQAKIFMPKAVFDYIAPGMLLIPEQYWYFFGSRPELIPRPTSFADAIQNILMFIPLGVLLALRVNRMHLLSVLLSVCAAAGISICFEVLQIGFSRNPSATDVLCNTTGAIVGFLVLSISHLITCRR